MIGAAARIVQPGKNCWRVERANRFFCIQDAAEYFRLVRLALLSARETVFLLGWDTTAGTDLLPGAEVSDAPARFGQLLKYVAHRRPSLRCYILTWDHGMLYALERDPLSRWRLGWRMPRGVRFGFDGRHPAGASHHQKIIVVDDQLAFCGGIDITGHRWDTSAHRPDEPARKTPQGKAYEPYHEVQAMVSGSAAAALGELARDRWRTMGTERMPPVSQPSTDLWPSDVTADLTDADVAIARTMPEWGSRPAIRECEALFLDSIAVAERAIYIESQYFTSEPLAAALAARLQQREGPEIIVVAPKDCHGWLEQSTMCAFRDGAFRAMIAADTHKRLRIVYPIASRARDIPTFIHSKVMVVDDVLVRIGSANLSQRSLGMDTECDLAADAAGHEETRTGIRRIRDRLLAEHLGMPVEDVSDEITRSGSLCALIDAHAHAEHTLVRIDMTGPPTPPSELLRNTADPGEPKAFGAAIDSLAPAPEVGGSPRRLWILPGVAAVAAAVSAASLGYVSGSSPPLAVSVAGFLVAGLFLIPLELLAIAAGVLLGGVDGGIVAFTGSLAATVIGYVAGRAIGPARITRWVSPRSYRSVRQWGAGSLGDAVLLRLSAVASAGAVHLISGAGRLPFGTYLAGSAIALVPTTAAFTGLGVLLQDAVLRPSVAKIAVTAGAALLLAAAAVGLRAFLMIRQFAPSIFRHRQEAEFG